ncbi:MAG: ABC transporter ATP-binding protein [Bifidobacteriaceae bacterium]|nr:ABC transporter ATP-binding protein [Bifidobacteriaceae bacterium]
MLRELNVVVEPGCSVAVMGRSGTGKSTLLSVIGGLIRPDSGSVWVDGEPVHQLNRTDAARYRAQKVGIVFQSGELLPDISAEENVALAGVLGGKTYAQASAESARLLESVEIGKDLHGQLTRELSGGEQARVAVARALIGQPAVLLADEPTGSLDAELRQEVQTLLYGLPRSTGCCLVLVTHDPLVAQGADKTMTLSNGKLAEQPAQEPLAAPAPAASATPATITAQTRDPTRASQPVLSTPGRPFHPGTSSLSTNPPPPPVR